MQTFIFPKLGSSNSCPEQTDARGRFITTYSGEKFYIEEVNLEDIPVYDIAHALSMNCRFNGHIEEFYSVAEHSVVVSKLVPNRYKLAALMHDIGEAFVPDIPRPFKSLIQGFDEYEEQILDKAANLYGFNYPLPYTVQYVDKHIVRAEAGVLMRNVPDWVDAYQEIVTGDEARDLIQGLLPPVAAELWMEEFALCMYRRAAGEESHDCHP